ncbi:MAG: DegT/DnrJ/EryC1/StrS family aminotransferase [Alphaproteobacteria bacterium]|nr:DegT/DnrJ/EryC1/StrS family aminotransferase [Alphaproteobacteria bacterium]
MSSDPRQAAIDDIVARYLEVDPYAPVPDDRLPLAVPGFGAAEVAEAIDSLLSGWLTMGRKVQAFERAWADYLGVKHCVMVNSGSSALLVMLRAVVETGRMAPGDELIVPAVAWSTDLFATAQAGLTPVVVDVDPDTLNVEGEWDRPVLAVHLLGQPSRATGPLVLEDACGAHGARIDGRAVGGRGLASVFSFFFSHHLTTIEGGAVVTDDDEFADHCRGLRAHGWVRERSDRAWWEQAHPEIDPRFLFASAGFNVRPTEIAGAFGIHQIPRLDSAVAIRRRNHQDWCDRVDALGLPLRTFPEAPGTEHASFGLSMLLDASSPLTRAQLCERLEARGVQTRAISGGNLVRQPAFAHVPRARVEGDLTVADAVHERGFFVGNSHAFGDAQGQLLEAALRDAFAG